MKYFETLRSRLDKLKASKIFETSIVLVIMASAIMVGASTYPLESGTVRVISMLDSFVTAIFVVEISIRLLAEKRWRDFFKVGWNIFDFVIVAISLIPVDESEMVLVARLVRIFRVLRLVSFVPELRSIITSLIRALPKIGYVAILMFIIFYIYGTVGSILFENINQELWGNVSISMLTLFRIATFEDWTDVMYETMDVYGMSWMYYLSFIFLIAFVFLNMMVGIVVDQLGRDRDAEMKKEHDSEIESGNNYQKEILEKLEKMETLLKENGIAVKK